MTTQPGPGSQSEPTSATHESMSMTHTNIETPTSALHVLECDPQINQVQRRMWHRLGKSGLQVKCRNVIVEASDIDELIGSIMPTDYVILGGGSYDPTVDVPCFRVVERVLTKCLDSGIHLLCVCLSHQLASLILGGKVDRAGPEFGATRLTLTDQGTEDELLRPFWPHRELSIFHSHEWSVVQAPSGSTRLAFSEVSGNQVLRHGPTVWAMQGHPETHYPLAYDDFVKQFNAGNKFVHRAIQRHASMHGLTKEEILTVTKANLFPESPDGLTLLRHWLRPDWPDK